MAHNHSHQHNSSTKNIKVAFFLNFAFTIIEFIGGIYTNSLAITSDALHDLGDSLSLGLSWYFQKKSKQKPSKTYTYGYKRFSLLGAIINSIVLLIGSIYIISEAIPRIINPQEADAKGMMYFAILGIIVNGAAVFQLKKGTSINERVVALHLMEDVLGWVAVLVASIVMQFYNVPILDPILSLLITCYVLYNVFVNGKESIRIVLQGTPKEISTAAIKEKILTFEAIKNVHDCHLWTMDGEYNVFTIHVILKIDEIKVSETATIKKQLRKMLHNEFELEHITIEIEISNEDCGYKTCISDS